MFFRFSIACLLLLGVTIGCAPEQKKGPEGLVPVTGTVKLDGSPLSGATVTFISTGASGGLDAGGVTDQSGKYELKAGEGSSPGAKPGEYRVVISRLVNASGAAVIPDGEKSPMQLQLEGAKETVPAKYSDILNSEYKATVPASGGTIDIELEAK